MAHHHAPFPSNFQVQGTVLMHISTLLKYDAALGAEWLKHFKAKGVGASPFLLQVGLQHGLLWNLLRSELLGPCALKQQRLCAY